MNSFKLLLVILAASVWTVSVHAQESSAPLSSSQTGPLTFSPSLVTMPKFHFADADSELGAGNFVVSPDEIARARLQEALQAYDKEQRLRMDQIMHSLDVDGSGPFRQSPIVALKPAPELGPSDFRTGSLDPEVARQLYALKTERAFDSIVDRLPRNIARIEGKLGKLPVRLDYGYARHCHLKAGLCLRVQLP